MNTRENQKGFEGHYAEHLGKNAKLLTKKWHLRPPSLRTVVSTSRCKVEVQNQGGKVIVESKYSAQTLNRNSELSGSVSGEG